MAEWIRHSERVLHTERKREFAYEGYVRNGRSDWGFSFPVDENDEPCDRFGGEVNPAALDNWAKCLTGEADGRKVIDLGVQEDSWWVTEPGLIKCGCGELVELNMVMTNTCDECDTDYNSSGQMLAPREQWGWDTGESVSDILMSDQRVDGEDRYEEEYG